LPREITPNGILQYLQGPQQRGTWLHIGPLFFLLAMHATCTSGGGDIHSTKDALCMHWPWDNYCMGQIMLINDWIKSYSRFFNFYQQTHWRIQEFILIEAKIK
jgi:hypothetical protein